MSHVDTSISSGQPFTIERHRDAPKGCDCAVHAVVLIFGSAPDADAARSLDDDIAADSATTKQTEIDR